METPELTLFASPAKALESGKLYLLQVDGRLNEPDRLWLQEQLKPYTAKYGCEFFVLDQSISLVDPSSFDCLVDRIASRLLVSLAASQPGA